MIEIEVTLKSGVKLKTETYTMNKDEMLSFDKKLTKNKFVQIMGVPVLIICSDEVAGVVIK